MKVIMKKTSIGSPNGISVIKYIAGKEYDIPEDLGNVFVDVMKVANKVVKPEIVVEIKEKVKSIKSEYEDKSYKRKK